MDAPRGVGAGRHSVTGAGLRAARQGRHLAPEWKPRDASQ